MFTKISDTFERLSGNTIFLATVAALVFFLFVVSSYLIYHNTQNETIQSVEADVESQVRMIAVSIEEYFRGKKDSVRLMAHFRPVMEYLNRVHLDTISSDPFFTDLCSLLIAVGGPDKTIATAWLASLREDFLVVSHDEILYEQDGWITRERPWYPGLMKSEDTYFSDPYWDLITGDLCVSLLKTIYAPLSEENRQRPREVVGVAGLDLFFPPIRQIMDEFVRGDARYPVLISRDGSILYHPNEQFVFKQKLEDIDPVLGQFVENMRHMETAVHLITLHEGERPVYFGYVPVEGTTWSVGVIWDKHDAEKTLAVFKRTLIQSLLLNLLLFVIPILFFGFLLTRRTRRFLKMKRLYDTIMNQMQTGVAVIDPNTDRFLLTNTAYESFLGIPHVKTASFADYHSILYPENTKCILHVSLNNSGESSKIVETKEVMLRVNDSECYFTHFFASFSDYVGRQLYLSVLTEVTELKRMQDELRSARDVSEFANRAKSMFLANMSHEMRTPLNAIIGLSELSLGASEAQGDVGENLKKIYSSGITLLSTINDLLDISKIEAGKLELIAAEYDMPSLINDAVALNSVRIGSKPIQFTLEVDENLPRRFIGDELRVKQMLNNILSNAFKYTREGEVKWSISSEYEGRNFWLVFTISDTGIGIRKEDMAALFYEYHQVDAKANRQIEGTGLGLALVKRMAGLMGGTISVESEYGKGSTFTLRIKQKPAINMPIGRNVAFNLEHNQFSQSKLARNAQLVRLKTPYARVLVVDDVQANLDVARGMLKPYELQVDCVTSGQQAIDVIRNESVRYNAIFMDHMMPEMDGIETTQKIRELGTEYAINVPVIALTANAVLGNEEMFLENGFQAFLSKPIDILQLDVTIRRWIRDRTQESAEMEHISPMEVVDSERQPTWGIEGLDKEKALVRFGNSEETLMIVLQSFVKNTPDLLDKIRTCTEAQLSDYTLLVHGIKGTCYGICADQVGKQAESLERAAKQGDYSFVSEHNTAFIESVEVLIDRISAVLWELNVKK